MNIREINIDKYPVCIFTDAHCNINNIKKLQRLYPNNLLLSLGDATFLFSKPGESRNRNIIDFLIQSKIPHLLGNHCEYILSCNKYDNGNSLIQFKAIPQFFEEGSLFNHYNLDKHHIDYLKKLPIGFKLLLPDGNNILCYHNKPKDLWGWYDKINKDDFMNSYPIDEKTLGVLRGHHHTNSVIDYHGIKCKLYTIGQLCGSDHHGRNISGNNYAILTEKGIEFKKI